MGSEEQASLPVLGGFPWWMVATRPRRMISLGVAVWLVAFAVGLVASSPLPAVLIGGVGGMIFLAGLVGFAVRDD